VSRSRWYEGLDKRCDVKFFVPGDERVVEIAEERTKGMVAYFEAAISHVSWMMGFDCIRVLARSCYLQGLNDAIDAAARVERKRRALAQEKPSARTPAPSSGDAGQK